MRLSAFIVGNIEPILQEWEDFARSLGAITSSMDAVALRDHAEQMLVAIAANMETPQSPAEQEAKGTGHAPPLPLDHPQTAATSHGALRAGDGFTLDQMVSEYRALRASVLRLWARYERAKGGVGTVRDSYDQQARFHEAVDEALTDSIHVFSHAVDQMFAAKARRRMEAMGTLAAGLGHDMANVLIPMRVCLTTLKKETCAPEIAPAVDSLGRAVNHLGGLTKSLRAFAMDPEEWAAAPESTMLHEWWATAISPFTWALPKGVKLHVEGLDTSAPPLPPVRVPAHVLMQAVFNIVQNAAQAHAQRNLDNAAAFGAAPTGNIWVRAGLDSHTLDPEKGHSVTVNITIRDDGPGMDSQTARRCTDPFFTTKSKNLGSGLGLYVVRSVLERHGAKLRVDSKLDEGSTFTILLPVAPAEVMAHA